MFYKKAILTIIGLMIFIFFIQAIVGFYKKSSLVKQQGVSIGVIYPEPEIIKMIPKEHSTQNKRYFSEFDKLSKELSSANDNKKRLSKPTMKNIQIALRNAGFNPGTIDGRNGPKTKEAIKLFQKKFGLGIDGMVGPKTWELLGKYLRVSSKSKKVSN